MPSKPSRLSKNRHGTYCLRWIVPARYRDADDKPRELRFSLRTSDTVRARILALEFNLALERLHAMTKKVDPRTLIAPWTLEFAGMKVEVKDAEDQSLFNQFLVDNPDIRQRMLESIRAGTDPAVARLELMASVKEALIGASGVVVPMKFPAAIDAFVNSRSALAKNRDATIAEKKRTLNLLGAYLTSLGTSIEEFPVHELTARLILNFITSHASRPGKESLKDQAKERKEARKNGNTAGTEPQTIATPTKSGPEKKPKGLGGGTLSKIVANIKEFVAFAKVQDWIKANPLGAEFDEAVSGIKDKAKESKVSGSYKVFTENEIVQIFEPKRYLARNKSVDEFWVPLLALYSGARLGEVTDLNLEDIGIDADSGVPYMQIGTKNENSVRKVPIHDTLIEMGFLDIVEHVKSLGSTRLYPHRPLNPTRIENSGKLMSRNFGAFLDVVGIESSQLVFHSFRHTAITRMHVRHVPVAEAELIVGHASQDKDVRNSAFSKHVLGHPLLNFFAPTNLKTSFSVSMSPCHHVTTSSVSNCVNGNVLMDGNKFWVSFELKDYPV